MFWSSLSHKALLLAFKDLQACQLMTRPSLDEWLTCRALANQLGGASRTFAITDQDDRVFGYYALAAGAVSHQASSSGVQRDMPDPVLVLARLAVDYRVQGFKSRRSLLQDAVHRTVFVSQNA